ncbi:MAG: O-antigen ligase family protein [Parvibaculaceae bacterium]|nr:O-antigen ligase family protein [Parvibaculaceae bacterium]
MTGPDKARRALEIGFLLFLPAGYIVAPEPTWSFFFYTLLLPLIVYDLWRQRRKKLYRDPVVLLALALIGWIALSMVWGVDQSGRMISKYLNALLTNSAFLLGGISFFALSDEVWRQRFMRWLPLAAGLGALISFWHFYVHLCMPLDERLDGWAELRQPILGSNVILVAGLFALRNIAAGKPGMARAWQVAAAFLILAFVILAGSRGPLTALTGSVLAMLILLQPRRVGLIVLAVAAAVAVLSFVPAVHDYMATMLGRDSMRGEIWWITLEYVKERPLLGYGAANTTVLLYDNLGRPQIVMPHSIYMSALFYTGIIGLALLIALFAGLALRALRLRDRIDRALATALLAVPVIAGLTDISQSIKPPTQEWYIIWLPAIFILGLAAHERRNRSASQASVAESLHQQHGAQAERAVSGT